MNVHAVNRPLGKRSRLTTQQRDRIRQLLKKLELNTRNVCLMHRPVFEAARIWRTGDLDSSLDSVLDALTAADASCLIDALQKLLGDDA